MPSPRPFRFAVQASRAETPAAWRELARRAEALGYSTLSMPDHLDDQYAPVPALMAAAAATTTLRVGTLVFANDYRHPVMLAKECATLDLLTDGRLELGLGAGWMRTDYDGAGMAYDRPGTRIARMAEALDILDGLFADGPFTYEGTHYRVSGLEGTPKPVQQPRPPVLIGGGGPKVLALAGRRADIVGINVDLSAGAITAEAGRSAAPASIDEKLRWVRDAAGDRFDAIELQCRAFVAQVTPDRDAMAALLADGFGLTPEDALGTPLALVGTVAQLVETLLERRERWGFSYIGIGPEAMDDFAPVVAALAGR